MKIRLIFLIALPAALFLGLLYHVYTHLLPDLAEQSLQTALRDSGFHDVRLDKLQSGRDYVMYENVSLDPDGISTIQTLAVKYSLLGLLYGRQFERLQIHGLSLTGEIHSDQTPYVSISGWTPADIMTFMQNLPARELNIKSSRIAVLTEDFGGVTLNFEAQATRHKTYADLQIKAGSAQKNLNFALNATGRLQSRTASLELEIERGKVEWDRWQIKASRISGKATHTQDSEDHENDTALQIGGLNFLGMPWQNIGASIEANESYLKVIAGGKSVGLEGLELGIDIEKIAGRPPGLSAFIHFETLGDFLDYYYANDYADLTESQWDAIRKISGLTVYLVASPVPGHAAKLDIISKLEHPAIQKPIARQFAIDFTKEMTPRILFDQIIDRALLLEIISHETDQDSP